MKQIYYAIQNIIRDRGSNVTKVLSLALGLTIGVLLFSQIAYELSYDKCWTEWEQLVAIRRKVTNNHVPMNWTFGTEGTIASTIIEDLEKEVQSATMYSTFRTDDLYKADGIRLSPEQMYVDERFFETFGIPVLKGNPREDLMMANHIYISESYAKKIFGDENPIGKTLLCQMVNEYTIKGIFKDIPGNTLLAQADIILSAPTLINMMGAPRWGENQVWRTVARLKDANRFEEFERKVHPMTEKYITFDEAKTGYSIEYGALPLHERYLQNADARKRLVILGILGFSVLFVALMNYILVSVATLSRRAKMAGVHKCNGASSSNILGMFLIETVFIVGIALLIAAFLILNFSELIEDLLSTDLSWLFTWQTLWVPLLCIVVVFAVGGFIPGYLYARIPATQAFRRYTDGKKGWKRSLLFVQFAGVSFILGVLLVTLLQYHYLMTQPLGYNPDGLVTANILSEQTENIMDDIRRQPMVESVASAHTGILSGNYYGDFVTDESGKSLFHLQQLQCDKDLHATVGLELTEGRWPNPGETVVNEEFVRLRGWTDGVIGKTIESWMGPITGVFKNYRNMGIVYEVTPLAMIVKGTYPVVHVRLKEPFDVNRKRLEEYLHATYPKTAIELKSVNEVREEWSASTYRFRNSVLITSAFIILIVLMGLIGYVNDETQRRSKEIAIRKVNGGEASDILRLLSRDILWVSVPSVLMGTVIAWLVGKTWLEQFADTVPMSPLYFVAVALLVLALIVVCVVVKVWRIANENPVLSIKSE